MYLKNKYLKNIAILTSGTAVAHALSFAVTPFLTKLYHPNDFGYLAFYSAFVGSLSTFVCGKFDVATVVVKKDSHAKEIFGISVLFTILSSSVLFIFAIYLHINDLFGLHSRLQKSVIFFIPLTTLAYGLISSCDYLANRFTKYNYIVEGKIILALCTASCSLYFGYLNVSSGLVYAVILSTLIVSFYLGVRVGGLVSPKALRVNKIKKLLFYRFKDYPIYFASTSLLNGITLFMPVFFMAYYFEESQVGFYFLVYRVVFGPLGIIASSVYQVNLKKVSDLINENKLVRPYLLKSIFSLSIISAFPLLLIYPFSIEIFDFTFGNEWSYSGEIFAILMPSIVVRFVASALSSTLSATANNHYFAIWKTCSFLVTLSSLYLSCQTGNINIVFKVMCVTDILLYTFYLFLIWRCGKSDIKSS